MASYGWRKSRSVEDGLYEEGHRFSFLQAVRLLEEMYLRDGRTAPGEGLQPDNEVVRFRHAVRMDFPPTDVEEIVPPARPVPRFLRSSGSSGSAAQPQQTAEEPRTRGPEDPAGRADPAGAVEMVVNVLGLAGALGPLPPLVSDAVVQRARRKDTAFRDFLDIFNHRLISIFYRARKRYRPVLDPGAPDGGRMAGVLYAFAGLAMPNLRGRMRMVDRALLPYAGLLVDRYRSMIGLLRLVEDYFDTKADVVERQGKWLTIEQRDRTAIGARGRNQRLGENVVLGKRAWDEAASFEVRLGPLSFEAFMALLPNGIAYDALVAAVRFYVREEIGFTVRLALAAAAVPELHLGRGGFLGWTTWLRTKPFTADDSQVRLQGAG